MNSTPTTLTAAQRAWVTVIATSVTLLTIIALGLSS
jgi:hypothetical protein